MVTVVFEDDVTTIEGEARDDELWVRPAELARALGWELKPEGLCHGSICVPVSPGRHDALVRADGALDVAAIARERGQAVVHDADGTAWVCGRTPERGARSLLAPDFTLPDLDGTPHTLSSFRGRKVLLDSWASW